MKEMLYEVRYLKSSEDMILALAGQFKQLSHEPEKFRSNKIQILKSTKPDKYFIITAYDIQTC